MEQTTISPCARVPPEILRKIFLTLRNMNTEDDEIPHLAIAEKDLLSVCVVSKQWRAVALDSSYLWSRAVYIGADSLGPAGALEHFKMSFVRSGQQKLCVVICAESEDPRLPSKNSPSVDFRPLHSIMALVMPHIHRVERLDISITSYKPASFNWLFSVDPMSLLDKAFPWSGVPLSSLKYLAISMAVLSARSFHMFLQHGQQLVELKLVHVVVVPTSAADALDTPLFPLPLPSLQHAEWDAILLHALQKYGPVSMPKPPKLILRLTAPYEILPIMPIPSFPTTITDLTLVGPFSDEAALRLLLPYGAEQNQPFAPHDGRNLRVLRLHGCEAGPELFSFLSRPAFPNLACLEVVYGNLTNEDVLGLLDAYDKLHGDFKSDGPFEVHIHYCPHTTKKLSNVLRERGNGTWLKRQRDQPEEDFMPFSELGGLLA